MKNSGTIPNITNQYRQSVGKCIAPMDGLRRANLLAQVEVLDLLVPREAPLDLLDSLALLLALHAALCVPKDQARTRRSDLPLALRLGLW
mmetsp:Transcript_69210/g.84862  ORF Transcript_69210/g.84862 Transcript_69210/m.84862 type:complete len:90 (+) Transcript_69210:618-887(+)